jgi:uroporphyrinogen decarboxylase
MNERLLVQALHRNNQKRPPVWFMRQAGRYHSHYQQLRKKHSFVDLCKKPEVACEATMGPIRDFDFDAAILFSDLLFPLETMGMGLQYVEGPQLDWHLKSLQDLKKLKGGPERAAEMGFQADAIRLIRKELSSEKALLGFVGGVLTLFFYAVSGSHKGDLSDSKKALKDGRFEGFCDQITELLAENMALQARAGIDVLAVLDTCAGEISAQDYSKIVVPATRKVLDAFHRRCPEFPILYYSKGTGAEFWTHQRQLGARAWGVDWRTPMDQVLRDWHHEVALQGNIDPEWLFLDPQELERRLRTVFSRILALPKECREGWICGLGHGVLPKTPEDNVRLFLRLQKEMFS